MTAIRQARVLVGRSIDGVPSDVRDTAVLLTSEIVTNAVLHGGGNFTLWVEVRADRLRVSVVDDNPRPPEVLRVGTEREHGRGMAIVASEASAWGAHLDGHKKTVWFELTVPETPPGRGGGTVVRRQPGPGRAWRADPGRPHGVTGPCLTCRLGSETRSPSRLYPSDRPANGPPGAR